MPAQRGVSVVAAVGFVAALAAAAPVIAQDASRGRDLFEFCMSCHSVDPDQTGLPGPNLAGLIGRRVGGDGNYDYSPVFRAANAEGRVWDVARLERFLADPEAMFPGMWMTSTGLRDAEDRRALVRFLAGPGAQ